MPKSCHVAAKKNLVQENIAKGVIILDYVNIKFKLVVKITSRDLLEQVSVRIKLCP